MQVQEPKYGKGWPGRFTSGGGCGEERRGVCCVFGGEYASSLKKSLRWVWRGVWGTTGGEFVIYLEGSSQCVCRGVRGVSGGEFGI